MAIPSVLGASVAALLTVIAAQASSPEQAAELVRLMQARQSTVVAAADPAEQGRFVAALVAGQQLLVIRARYSAPSVLREKILKGDHQQVYADLHGAGERQGRLFVMDSGADGLKLARESSDVAWHNAEKQWIFNADWKGQKMSEADYRRQFEQDEKAYADMLMTLITAIKTTSTVSDEARR